MKIACLLLASAFCSAVSQELSLPLKLSAKCASTEKAVVAKSKAYEIKLENASARLFEKACHEIQGPPHACNAVFNWTYFSKELHQYQDAVDSVDKNAQICFMNMDFNMKIHSTSGIMYHYILGDAGLFPVSASCTADDRNAILLHTYTKLLEHTTRALPDAVVSDVSVTWSDPQKCAGPSDCIHKEDFSCFAKDGFCQADVDKFCPAGTMCSAPFHAKYPDKDPCIALIASYGCDKATKTCVEGKGYESKAECDEACK